MCEKNQILTDARWPENTGIGKMYRIYKKRLEKYYNIKELHISTKIGSPFSFAHLSFAASKEKNKIFWNPGFIPIASTTKKTFITVHDLGHLKHYGNAKKIYYNYILKYLYKQTTKVICVSEFSRREFIEWSGLDVSNVLTIPNGIEPNFSDLAQQYESDKPYFFYPGNRRSFKNVPLIVKAFFASKLHFSGFDLYLTGPPETKLREIALRHNGEKNLVFLGNICEEQLVGFYKGATGVIYLSSYEGFGLPILESMACGCPILVTNAGAIKEVAGDAAIYANINNFDEIISRIIDIAERKSYVQRKIVLGFSQIKKYDIDASCAKLQYLFNE